MAKDRHDPGTLDIEEWLARNPSSANSRDHQHVKDDLCPKGAPKYGGLRLSQKM